MLRCALTSSITGIALLTRELMGHDAAGAVQRGGVTKIDALQTIISTSVGNARVTGRVDLDINTSVADTGEHILTGSRRPTRSVVATKHSGRSQDETIERLEHFSARGPHRCSHIF